MDRSNINAQNLNAKALLSRFQSRTSQYIALHYHEADLEIMQSPNIKLIQLLKGRLWPWHLIVLYLERIDAIFYPGIEWMDIIALKLRRKFRKRIPVIATLEGLAGNSERENQLSKCAGHPVYCEKISLKRLIDIDFIFREASHIIAISPFLASIGIGLYGDKCNYLPLGIDCQIFHSRNREPGERFTVVGAGNCNDRKRPEMFLILAERYPEADFIWYGSGEKYESILRESDKRGLINLRYPGQLSPAKLAESFRRAHLFVLPSRSEGAPKVVQEAAACGLPVIIYGNYETPHIIDGENGYVVWDDEELFARVGELIANREKAYRLGEIGAKMALEWDWDKVTPLWEKLIEEKISEFKNHSK